MTTDTAPAPSSGYGIDPLKDLHYRASMAFARCAVISLVIGTLAGVMGVLHYLPDVSRAMQAKGAAFTMARPLHETFITAWIFLAGLAVVHRFLGEEGAPPTVGDRWRIRAQFVLWGLAGLGALVTLLMGITSGREYIGFHPALSSLILAGWILFGWTFFRSVYKCFWGRPVQVTMWAVAIPFFAWTFIEQHAWLLPRFFSDPIADMRVQWMASGTLVGSFNLVVYGCLLYMGSRLADDEHYGFSRMAYALFGVGLLNSFTNFGHHTYHLPQSHAVKWISFIVSMTELIILARVGFDVVAAIKKRQASSPSAARSFLVASKWWTVAMLFTALILSVPSFNSLVHGTHVITGHAMGAEIGIDSMVLLAGLAWLCFDLSGRDPLGASAQRLRRAGLLFNISAAALVTWLHVSGTIVGVLRYQRLPPPDWHVTWAPTIFVVTGLGVAFGLLAVLWELLPALTAMGRTPAKG